MNRSVPVWFVLLLLLCGLLFTALVAWSVRSTLQGSTTSGPLGRVAVAVAGFPTTAMQALREARDYGTGDFRDLAVSLPREKRPDAPGFAPLESDIAIGLDGPAIRVTGATVPGWRFFSGTFQFDGTPRHAALLMSPELRVVRHWLLEEPEFEGLELRPPHRVAPHGIELLPDGSVIASFDHGETLQRLDACGDRVWSLAGRHHHAVTLTEGGDTVWTLRDRRRFVEIAVADGTILREIDIFDIMAANPLVDPLGMRRLDWQDDIANMNTRNATSTWLEDRFHFNDVDPLPASLADRFPMFEAGDLVISARSLNLVLVFDPDTLEIKWWRNGAVRRQHDPDWMETGEIMVYDNRMNLDYSRIVAIDPATYAVRTLHDGQESGFYSRVRGKQQPRSDGSIVITAPQQGHAFEISPDGEITFEIVNAKPGTDDQNYAIMELIWFPEDALNPEAWTCPT